MADAYCPNCSVELAEKDIVSTDMDDGAAFLSHEECGHSVFIGPDVFESVAIQAGLL